MDLIRHLRFFVMVADKGHFGRAAAALGMTQPPLSQGLRRLEEYIGTPLVHRTRQGAVLTSAGDRLLAHARQLVDESDRFLTEAVRVADTRGRVRWGAGAALPDRLLTACVAALCAETDAAVATESGTTVELIDAVRSGSCDFAIVEHPAQVDGVVSGPVTKVPRWVVVPSDHRSAQAERPRFPMLSDLTFAAPPRTGNPAAFDAVRGLFHDRGLDVDTTSARDDRAVLAAVAAGTHFGLSTTAPGSAPGVAWLQLAPAATAVRLGVVWRTGADTDRFVSALDRVLVRERVR